VARHFVALRAMKCCERKRRVSEPQRPAFHPGQPGRGITNALDLWFEHIVKPKCRGRVLIIRYVDDFVCAFQYHDDAAQFQLALEGRLGKFQLSLAPEKTRSFRFNRFFVQGEKFDFLGFTFRWSKNSKGSPQVWRQTAKDRFRRALSRFFKRLESGSKSEFCLSSISPRRVK